MRSKRLAVFRPRLLTRALGLLALLSVPLASQPVQAQAQRGVNDGRIKVLVAVLPFRIHSARPLDYLERSLPDLLSSRLEASGRVRVVEALSVRETLIARGDERTEDALRRLARELGADYVVAGSLTELAGRYSLDVRVTPIATRFSSRTFAFNAAGDDELLDRVDELADRVLELVGSSSPRTRIAEVRVEGVSDDFANAARGELELRPGQPYQGAAAERDLATLRALPGVATATVSTDRGPAGVVVVYRLVPSERILPEPETRAGVDPVGELVIRGNRRIEANAIRTRISTREGDPFDPVRIAADVREVYGLGFFRDVRVLTDEGIDGRIVIFEVKENPVIRQVSITGNDAIDGDKIRDVLTLTTGSTLDQPLLFENKERIEALYRAEGYYLADVDYEIEAMGPDGVSVDFAVDENKKLRLKRIVFEGNEHFSDEELVSGLATRTWRWYSPATRFLDRSGTYAEPVFLQDMQAVGDRYLNAGFLQAQIGDPVVTAEDDGLVVGVEIEEGPRFHVGAVDVSGDETLDLLALRDQLELEPGDVFNRSYLTSDVQALERHYTNRGFFFARVNPRTIPDDDEQTVAVTFEVEKGPLHFIREIDIAGNTTTVDPVVRREVQVVEGQLYSQRAIEISRARIRNLGFFEEVEFEPRRTDEPDQLDLGVRVVERPTGSLSFGAGFSSQDGFVVSGGLSQSNLFGRGYAVSLSADLGGDSDRFFFSFTDPYFMGSTWAATAQLSQSEIEFEDFEQEQSGAEFTLSHALNETGQSRGFLRYSWSSREINEDNEFNAAGVIFREFLDDAQTTSLLGVSFRSDTRDDRLAPTRGAILGASIEGAGLGGFAKFLRIEGRSTFFFQPKSWFPNWFPFREKSTFVLGARAGWVLPFNDASDFESPAPLGAEITGGIGSDGCRFDDVCLLESIDDDLDLPLTERYFLGGLGTFQLRGFRARSVGPRRALLARNALVPANTGGLFAPVGVNPSTATLFGIPPGECGDFPGNPFFGDGDGKCNSLDDEEDSDFEDLDETDVVGGNKFLSLTTEYRFPISESLGLIGIVFMDVGNAFDENQSLFDVGLWRYGTGVGVQWFSPFGPLQAFLGIPLDRLEVEDSSVFEFSVGGASF